ncbi:hypothetical protein CDAR_439791 [Caerostris darwini]|uniref:Uncharacterized protein n=1 Tax=Caerostris darwini TaxID=1538125 RepID=A0AAV4RYU8_9ARAC|nr:hypothetical protein CDAR_439791 [Caerostris darwini]
MSTKGVSSNSYPPCWNMIINASEYMNKLKDRVDHIIQQFYGNEDKNCNSGTTTLHNKPHKKNKKNDSMKEMQTFSPLTRTNSKSKVDFFFLFPTHYPLSAEAECAEHIQMWVSHGTLSPLFYFRKCLLIAVLSDLICNYFGRGVPKISDEDLYATERSFSIIIMVPNFSVLMSYGLSIDRCVQKKEGILPTFNSQSMGWLLRFIV